MREFVNTLLGIKESFEMPNALLETLLDTEKRKIFLSAMRKKGSASNDYFREYFQTTLADRDKLKQDYTPDCLCDLIAKLQKPSTNLLDVCSGTGALSLGTIKEQKGLQKIQCEELSKSVLPLLLGNLMLNNINATVKEKNILTQKTSNVYSIIGDDISIVKNEQEDKFDLIVSNPPFSQSWEPIKDERFDGYELPPKSKADFAFVLDIVNRLSDNGQAFIILPHGVLFRGAKEGNIRKQLIENNLLDSIIGLPENLFLNTGIPVCILALNKAKQDKNILFIDGSKLFTKGKKQNDMSVEHIDKIVSTYKERKDVDKLAHLANYEEIVQNDYNLNIPRYVDTFESEPLPDITLLRIATDLINRECKKSLKSIYKQMLLMKAEPEYQAELEQARAFIRDMLKDDTTDVESLKEFKKFMLGMMFPDKGKNKPNFRVGWMEYNERECSLDELIIVPGENGRDTVLPKEYIEAIASGEYWNYKGDLDGDASEAGNKAC